MKDNNKKLIVKLPDREELDKILQTAKTTIQYWKDHYNKLDLKEIIDKKEESENENGGK
jgi:hypothetical protein